MKVQRIEFHHDDEKVVLKKALHHFVKTGAQTNMKDQMTAIELWKKIDFHLMERRDLKTSRQ